MNWWGLWSVGQHHVDEDGGEEEDGAHHGEGEDEASDFIESSAHNWSDYLPWGIITVSMLCKSSSSDENLPIPKKSSIIANIEATFKHYFFISSPLSDLHDFRM